MNLANLAIKRPIFVSCVVILMLALGYVSLSRLPVDLFPNVTFPVVMVNTVYRGAGPEEVENLVSRPLEDELSTLPGISSITSKSREGVSMVIAEFNLETDIKNAEQLIRDRTGSAKRKLPKDIDEPMIRRMDPADQPILIVGLTSGLSPAKLYDLANEDIRTKIEQVNQVGNVEVFGGRKREIHVDLDRTKLKSHEISATQVANRLAAAGMNVPSGKVDGDKKETVFRTVGEFKSLADVENAIVNFIGNDVPVRVADVGHVSDNLTSEDSRGFVNGKPSVFLLIYRQSGANTVQVADAAKARLEKLNSEMKARGLDAKLTVVRDGAKPIRANIADVRESIILGVILTIVVVFFFLGSGRSTIITGLALPNSLLGAFLLMAAAGFTVNVMTLLALSLAVGLLIDDAIVVRENIFRHTEMGEEPTKAAIQGTKEVTLAVVATTLTVVAVFGSIGFLQGVVGQFFREFGLTVCFAMAISLFDAMTMAPMLSAYFVGSARGFGHGKNFVDRTLGRVLVGFDRFQDRLTESYEAAIRFSLRRKFVILGAAVIIMAVSLVAIARTAKTFMPTMDTGEFMVTLEMEPGTNLNTMAALAQEIETQIRTNPEVEHTVAIVGGHMSDSNMTTMFVEMVPAKVRKLNTTQFKNKVREQLSKYAHARPIVKDIDMVMGNMRPFTINIKGSDLAELETYANQLFTFLKAHPGLSDPEISYKPGKPEYQVVLDNRRAQMLGVSTTVAGMELRTQVEGDKPVKFRENGLEYDVRVRMRENERDLKAGFADIYVPNINYSLVRLSNISKTKETTGPTSVDRRNRSRYIQVMSDIAPNGPGMAKVMSDIKEFFKTQVKLPEGVSYEFIGQTEKFGELIESVVIAALLGTLFIFLVLASLYESFITPLTIMLVLPLALCGAFYALWLTGSTLDIFSMIGCIMLLGVATKNSILLVDLTKQLVAQGMEQTEAIVKAGRTRLRPILMTTCALIAGMLPIAIGLNEASRQRTSMGIAIIGGLVTSTLLTLVVIPAAYPLVERLSVFLQKVVKFVFLPRSKREKEPSLN